MPLLLMLGMLWNSCPSLPDLMRSCHRVLITRCVLITRRVRPAKVSGESKPTSALLCRQHLSRSHCIHGRLAVGLLGWGPTIPALGTLSASTAIVDGGGEAGRYPSILSHSTWAFSIVLTRGTTTTKRVSILSGIGALEWRRAIHIVVLRSIWKSV